MDQSFFTQLRNTPKNKNNKGSSGQVLIEFIFSFVFMVSILFVFIKISISSVDDFLAHYATFMASRTFLVADNNQQSVDDADSYAIQQATEVFKKYLHIGNGKLDFNVQSSGANKKVFTGAVFTKPKYFLVPGLFNAKFPMNIKSESFLGREPIKRECLDRICDAIRSVDGADSCSSLRLTVFDNGC